MDTPALAPMPPLRRGSVFGPLLASGRMQAYYILSQFRVIMTVAWPMALIEMVVARQLWIALYNGQAVYQGHTLDQTLTYVVLSMAIFNLLKGDGFLAWKIRSGNILVDLLYPLRFTTNLVAFSLASLWINLFTHAIPMLLMAVFLLKIPLPGSWTAWLAFTVSFLLGCLICNSIDNLANLLAFWTTETHGLLVWKDIVVGILSGAALPLWIFPAAAGRIIAWLPFRGIQYVPLSILVGWIGPEQYLRELAVQLVWVALLWLATEGLFELAMRRVEIQGG